MPTILDKFGKSSISTDYAVATTVKTTRVIGGTVLEAFDLSKYATDTPVFIITYKKTTDPVTGDVSVTNQVSYKALVNTGANTLTNLTVQPGYADLGNAIGDFIECIPTSAWENSLIDGIRTSLNDDGTLKTSAVQSALNITTTNPDWTPLATSPSVVTYEGNHLYTLTIPGVDYTDRVNPFTRLRITRSVPATTQSTSLNGTSQYWVKSGTINKMTFTDDFVVSAWIKLTSYTGSQVIIASRYNGTSGWKMTVTNTGQISLDGHNGAAGNVSYVLSNQSIPLNKWVHVTAQLDMSAFTTTPTTSYVMFDGVDVPASVNRLGTNPTSLVQAGNLEIGSANATQFFNGKIAQVAIFNSKVTQATMRTYISQRIAGTETSLASAYSFNGATTDLNTTTPNDLIAGAGSPTATNADSPFGTQASGAISSTVDYGVIQSATFLTNTTLVVQVPDGCTIPTLGSVAAVSYSGAYNPFGFRDPGNILASAILLTDSSSTVVTTQVDVSGLKITLYAPVTAKQIRLTLYQNASNGNGGYNISIWEGATNIQTSLLPGSTLAAGTYILTFSATPGWHTYQVKHNQSSAGTMTLRGSPSYPAQFIAEVL